MVPGLPARIGLVAALALVPSCGNFTALSPDGVLRFALSDTEVPRARSGQTIVLGKDDVIRVENPSRHTYRPTLEQTAQRFLRDAPHVVHFDAGSAQLDAEAQRVLDAQARWIRSNPDAKVSVTGHADDFTDPSDNEALSLARAHAVVIYLVEAGVHRTRLLSFRGARVEAEGTQAIEDGGMARRAETRVVQVFDRGQSGEGSEPVAAAPDRTSRPSPVGVEGGIHSDDPPRDPRRSPTPTEPQTPPDTSGGGAPDTPGEFDKDEK